MDAIKKNLRDELGPHEDGVRVMFCPDCDSRASAHRGDYWDVPEDFVFRCECGANMKIGVPYFGVYETEG